MYRARRKGLGDATAYVFELPALPISTQRAIASTEAPAFAEAESAAARQFGAGGGVSSWLAQNSGLVLIGAGTLVALAFLKRGR